MFKKRKKICKRSNHRSERSHSEYGLSDSSVLNDFIGQVKIHEQFLDLVIQVEAVHTGHLLNLQVIVLPFLGVLAKRLAELVYVG